MDFKDTIETVGKAIDLVGVGVIIVGIALASALAVPRLRTAGADVAFRSYRQGIGKAILLGLEFLVAADIIRTVAVTPSLSSVLVLALIVVIRTFLSFSLELEISGRWPWQHRQAPQASVE